jgi:hypothetical protein
MNRRDALFATASLLGTAIVGANAFLSGCSVEEKPVDAFGDETVALLDEIGETIIPATSDSPGAKAAMIGSFMKTIVMDCYSDDERSTFLQGINTLQSKAREKYSKYFQQLSQAERKDMLVEFDQETKNYKSENKPDHFFNMLNQLTVWGYFSSEPGATKAMRYVPVPGKYEGCVDYKAGEGAWVY